MKNEYFTKDTFNRWLELFSDERFPKTFDNKKIIKVLFKMLLPLYENLGGISGNLFKTEESRKLFIELLAVRVLDNVRIELLIELDNYPERNMKYYFKKDQQGKTRVYNYFADDIVRIIELVIPFVTWGLKFKPNIKGHREYSDDDFIKLKNYLIQGYNRKKSAEKVLEEKSKPVEYAGSLLKIWRRTDYFVPKSENKKRKKGI